MGGQTSRLGERNLGHPYLGAGADMDLTPNTVWEAIVARFDAVLQGFVNATPRMLLGLAFLLGTYAVARMARASVERLVRLRVQRDSLTALARQIAYVAAWIVGSLATATVVFPTLTLGNVVGALGLGSVAIGLAFKDIFENFFAGMLILWRFPFENDDVIECEGIEGRVEDVTVRMTLIRRLDGQLVVLPNALILKHPVTVRTNLPKRRITVTCQVAYGESMEEAREVIRTAVTECDSVSEDHDVEVLAAEFEGSGIEFLVRWWTDPVPSEERASRDEVVAAIHIALEEAGLEIPFPHRTLTFPEERQEEAG